MTVLYLVQENRIRFSNAQRNFVPKRKARKKWLIENYGRCCVRCGYSRCYEALHFHHVYPEYKLFTIASGMGRPWEELLDEVEKCVILCSNCHSERHYGVRAEGQFSSPRRFDVELVPGLVYQCA